MDNKQYLRQVREALDKNLKKLGDVWRVPTKENTNQNKSRADIAKDIAKELGDSTHNYVYQHLWDIDVITKGNLPDSLGVASKCGDNLRTFIDDNPGAFSEETIKELERRIEKCDRLATDLPLRHAYESVAKELDLDWFEEIKDFIENIIDAGEDQFFTEDYQLLLWEDNPICEAIPFAPGVNVPEVIQDRDFLNWFYDEYREIRNLDPQEGD